MVSVKYSNICKLVKDVLLRHLTYRDSYIHLYSHLLDLYFSDGSGKKLNSGYEANYEAVGIQERCPVI